MPLVTVVAGAYLGQYRPNQVSVSPAINNASGAGLPFAALGICLDNGFELSAQVYGQDINRTDQYAQTLLDGVYQGADWRIRYICTEYSANNTVAAWPWGNPSQAGFGAPVAALAPSLGVIGRRYSDVEGAIILNSTPGTPAANNPTTLTAPHVIMSKNTNLGMTFTSKVREVPIEQVMMPYASTAYNTGTFVTWFTTT